jgi:hypothetical protein
MYRREEVEAKVREFIDEQFPEIKDLTEETGVTAEITNVIFDFLTGEDE